MNLQAIKENIDQILEHYPEEKHPFLRHQIVEMVDFIASEKHLYTDNSEVQRILNSLLSKMIKGEFLP